MRSVSEGALDAAIDGALALAQALVLRFLGLVVGECGLQFGAQLPDLADQRRHRIPWRVAFDAKGPGFFGRELGSAIAAGLATPTGKQLHADKDQQQRHRDHQPLEQAITFHDGLHSSGPVSSVPAGSAPR